MTERIVKRITIRSLQLLRACEEQVNVFTREWPEGAELSQTVLDRAREIGLDVRWLAANALTGEHRDAYLAKLRPLNDAYLTQLRPLNDAYLTQRRPLEAAYYAQLKPLNDAYDAQLKTLDDAYDAQRKPLEDAYRAQIRPLEDAYDAQCKTLEDAAILAWAEDEQ